MASAPEFATIPRIGNANLSTANSLRDGTGTIPTVLTAGTNGTRIERVRLKATADPSDSIVTMFIHDGSLYHIFDDFDWGNPAAGSTTVESGVMERAYRDLVLPTGFSIRAAITVALTSGWVEFFAFGADL